MLRLMSLGRELHISPPLGSLLMNRKVNMDLPLGNQTQTVMFSIMAKSDFTPRAVQLSATGNLRARFMSLVDTNRSCLSHGVITFLAHSLASKSRKLGMCGLKSEKLYCLLKSVCS